MAMQSTVRNVVDKVADLVDQSRARIGASHEHIIGLKSMSARSRELLRLSRTHLTATVGLALAPVPAPHTMAIAPRGEAAAFDLLRDSLARHHWRGLNAIASSGPAFEPLSRYAGVGPRIADWLMRRGLAESRREPQRRQPALCYRATALGRQVLERGRHAPARASESA